MKILLLSRSRSSAASAACSRPANKSSAAENGALGSLRQGLRAKGCKSHSAAEIFADFGSVSR